MSRPQFYEASLSIRCTEGTIFGCISSSASLLYSFLRKHDHDGSSISMCVRDTPEQEPFRALDDPQQIYQQLQSWVAGER